MMPDFKQLPQRMTENSSPCRSPKMRRNRMKRRALKRQSCQFKLECSNRFCLLRLEGSLIVVVFLIGSFCWSDTTESSARLLIADLGRLLYTIKAHTHVGVITLICTSVRRSSLGVTRFSSDLSVSLRRVGTIYFYRKTFSYTILVLTAVSSRSDRHGHYFYQWRWLSTLLERKFVCQQTTTRIAVLHANSVAGANPQASISAFVLYTLIVGWSECVFLVLCTLKSTKGVWWMVMVDCIYWLDSALFC